MRTVKVVFGKSKEPAKFYFGGKRISVDTAFGMYQNKSRFVVGGKTLNVKQWWVVRWWARLRLFWLWWRS